MPSGYFIGFAALASLDTSQSIIFIDEGAHFNLLDAARLSGRPMFPFKHGDCSSLAKVLKHFLPPGKRPLVLTDGVFATTGRVAPLDKYADLIASSDGRLVIDEAHSFGVLGKSGLGAAEYHGVASVAASAATLSKAFCAQGAIIGCTNEVADKLIRVPPLRGANLGSPISAAVAAAALSYMQKHPERREKLAYLSTALRARLRNIGIEVEESPAPIVAFQLGDRRQMHELQDHLFERGIYVTISNYIGAGAEGMVRCAVFADHVEADFDALADGISTFPWQ